MPEALVTTLVIVVGYFNRTRTQSLQSLFRTLISTTLKTRLLQRDEEFEKSNGDCILFPPVSPYQAQKINKLMEKNNCCRSVHSQIFNSVPWDSVSMQIISHSCVVSNDENNIINGHTCQWWVNGKKWPVMNLSEGCLAWRHIKCENEAAKDTNTIWLVGWAILML